MPPFDPIASPTVRIAPHREPAFVFPDQAEASRQKLAALAARTRRQPNILVILFDDAAGATSAATAAAWRWARPRR